MTTITPLEEFPLFGELPAELRLKIWGVALSISRIVSIDCERKIVEGESRRAVRFYSTTPPPALLHVCQESRFEALSVYSPCFATSYTPNILYISWAQDTIRCLDRIIGYFGKPEAVNIRQMTLDVGDAIYFGHFHMETVRGMTSLKYLELLTQQKEPQGWSSRYMEQPNRDFVQERMEHLGWECPKVVIMNRDSGKELSVIKGGALVPGWTAGDERPEISEQDL